MGSEVMMLIHEVMVQQQLEQDPDAISQAYAALDPDVWRVSGE